MKRFTCPRCKSEYQEEPAACPVCGWSVGEDGPMQDAHQIYAAQPATNGLLLEAIGSSPEGRTERRLRVVDTGNAMYCITVQWGTNHNRRGCYMTAQELLAFLEEAQRVVIKNEAEVQA